MSDIDRGTDRAGRRSKRFLLPLQKYEVWLQTMRPPALALRKVVSAPACVNARAIAEWMQSLMFVLIEYAVSRQSRYGH